ncbi:MAG: HAD family hydrolase [Ferruginibacter sp.]
MKSQTISTLFLDVGGVLLTNGWDRTARQFAAINFELDLEELNERHHLTFDTYELGKLTLDEYLDRLVFYEARNFSRDDFKSFMFAQSQAFEENILFFKELKAKYRLKVFAVNNEGKELNEYRIKTFKLHELFDAFISSCYVKFRKPDADLFRMACNISQTLPQHTMHIDDRPMFVDVACKVGINGLHYTELNLLKEQLKTFNFQL